MISYEPLRDTLKEKSVTITYLVNTYGIEVGRAMLGQKNLNTSTVEKLCRILDCGIDDICCYVTEDKRLMKGLIRIDYDKIQSVMKSKGLTGYKLSLSMDKKSSYFTDKAAKKSAIRSSDLGKMLEVLGCTLEDIQ